MASVVPAQALQLPRRNCPYIGHSVSWTPTRIPRCYPSVYRLSLTPALCNSKQMMHENEQAGKDRIEEQRLKLPKQAPKVLEYFFPYAAPKRERSISLRQENRPLCIKSTNRG